MGAEAEVCYIRGSSHCKTQNSYRVHPKFNSVIQNPFARAQRGPRPIARVRAHIEGAPRPSPRARKLHFRCLKKQLKVCKLQLLGPEFQMTYLEI